MSETKKVGKYLLALFSVTAVLVLFNSNFNVKVKF